MSWTSPAVVGRYLADGRPEYYPVSENELQRATRAYLRVLDTYGLQPDQHVLVVSLASQVTYFMPLERALHERRLVTSNADATTFDAARVEMFVRRFDVAAVLGVDLPTLAGLEALGHSPAELFQGRIVWATPRACEALGPAEGYTLRAWTELGPAFAVECAVGDGLHVGSDDWHLDGEGGEILVTSRWPKLVPFERQPTGLHGVVDRSPCSCGGVDARVRLSPRPPGGAP